jgi:hypothetical protein
MGKNRLVDPNSLFYRKQDYFKTRVVSVLVGAFTIMEYSWY